MSVRAASPTATDESGARPGAATRTNVASVTRPVGLYTQWWATQMQATPAGGGAPTDGQPSASIVDSSVQVVGSGAALG
jgi:hypothetical protein